MAESTLRVGIRIQAWSIHIGRLDRMEQLKISETSAIQPASTPPCKPDNVCNYCRFHWIRVSSILGSSVALITWTVGPDAVPGKYRIRHFGSYKYIFGGTHPYEGTTNTFKVGLNLLNGHHINILHQNDWCRSRALDF
jgi:hypothetical protein